MIHYGDICKLNGAELPPVDIITGGSPCQDLSVAGKRAGLAGERSGLFMEQIRIIKEMRENDRNNGRTNEHIRPRYMVWENVPGALSSPGKRKGEDHRGEDYQVVLSEIVRIVKPDAPDIPLPAKRKWPHAGCFMGIGEDGQPFSVAYRLHDAQFWGVPQRRKRISLVADFGGVTAPEILFEREGLSGDITESGEAGKDAAADVRSSIAETGGAISFQERAGKPGGGKGILIQNEHTGALSTLNNQSVCYGFNRERCGAVIADNLMPTLQAAAGESGNNKPMVCAPAELFSDDEKEQIEDFVKAVNKDAKHQQDLIQSDLGVSRALACGTHASGSHLTKTLVTKAVAFEPGAASRVGGHCSEEVAGTVRSNAGDNQQAVVYGISAYESNAMKSSNPHSGIYQAETARTLDLNGGNPACNQGGMAVVQGADMYNGSLTGDIAATLNASSGDSPTHSGPSVVCLENHPADSRVKVSEDGMVQTLSGRMGTGGGNVPMVMEPVYVGNGQLAQARLSSTVGTLNCMHDQQAVMTYGLDRASFNQGINAQYDFAVDEEKIGTQVAKGPGAVCQSVVRRFTPMECERLQNFPDHWTDIGEWTDSKGKKHKDADSPRYKALGNSIALPFWSWMAKRMVAYIDHKPTMASLFDGIGGFPLVFSRAG